MKKNASGLTPRLERILDYMRANGNSITSMEAFRIGETRLSAAIMELRDKGYKIETIWCDTVNRYGEPRRYGRYVLVSEPAAMSSAS